MKTIEESYYYYHYFRSSYSLKMKQKRPPENENRKVPLAKWGVFLLNALPIPVIKKNTGKQFNNK